jgi:hypothetical protein
MGDKFYRIRKKGTDLYSTGGENPFWSSVGKAWTKLAHLNCHIQQVRGPTKRGSYGSYQYRHTDMERADYAEAEVVTFETVVVEVQDASTFLQAAKDRKAEKEKKKEVTRLRGRAERGEP